MHTTYDAAGQPSGSAVFDLDRQESEGTRKLFSLSGPLLAALGGGTPFVADEFDARLHPIMTRKLVELFNSRRTNPRSAQLIFTTQDANLLDNRLFRRDQIWFTEKDRFGATHLYSLAEFKGVRNDASFRRIMSAAAMARSPSWATWAGWEGTAMPERRSTGGRVAASGAATPTAG